MNIWKTFTVLLLYEKNKTFSWVRNVISRPFSSVVKLGVVDRERGRDGLQWEGEPKLTRWHRPSHTEWRIEHYSQRHGRPESKGE